MVCTVFLHVYTFGIEQDNSTIFLSIFKVTHSQQLMAEGEVDTPINCTEAVLTNANKRSSQLQSSPAKASELETKSVLEKDSCDEVLLTDGLTEEIPVYPECMSGEVYIEHEMDKHMSIQGPKEGENWMNYGGDLFKSMSFNPKLDWELALTVFSVVGNSTEDLRNIRAFKLYLEIELMNTEGEKQTVNFNTVVRPYRGCLLSDSVLEYQEVLTIFKIDTFRVKAYTDGIKLPSLSDYRISTGILARYGKCPSCYVCRKRDV